MAAAEEGEGRRVGRESVGGRRWRRQESASAASEEGMMLSWCAAGVGGGAEVALPKRFGT